MNYPLHRYGFALLAIYLLSVTTGLGMGITSKTIRVEHGRPLVVVSQTAVLLLEFIKEPTQDAMIPHDEPDWKHCRAKYHFRVLDGVTGLLSDGDGTVEEIYRVISRAATGQTIEDMGSKTRIEISEFSLSWSQATAGSRSWIYYRANSAIRFLQQPQQLNFARTGRDQLQRYLNSKNVEEFVTAGRSVQVIGPAVFSGDLPSEEPVSARIESCGIHEGAFELKLSDLATNRHYVIESSFEQRPGNWNAVHTFVAKEPKHSWSDPLAESVNRVFYRIREGQ
jgi:hypothetical protein